MGDVVHLRVIPSRAACRSQNRYTRAIPEVTCPDCIRAEAKRVREIRDGAPDGSSLRSAASDRLALLWANPHAARAEHATIVRAAIDDAARSAGVVLPEGYDVAAVLRDGVRTHGWRWCATPHGFRLHHGPLADGGSVLRRHGRWCHGMRCRDDYDTLEAAAAALWAAVGPEGLPMPPLPGEGA